LKLIKPIKINRITFRIVPFETIADYGAAGKKIQM
jgi:hypothetical protein